MTTKLYTAALATITAAAALGAIEAHPGPRDRKSVV